MILARCGCFYFEVGRGMIVPSVVITFIGFHLLRVRTATGPDAQLDVPGEGTGQTRTVAWAVVAVGVLSTLMCVGLMIFGSVRP